MLRRIDTQVFTEREADELKGVLKGPCSLTSMLALFALRSCSQQRGMLDVVGQITRTVEFETGVGSSEGGRPWFFSDGSG